VVWSPKIFLPDILSRPAPGKKTVYVALGTSGYEDALPAILEGLASRPLRVLVAAGPNKGVENPAPDRLEMHVSPFFSGQEACRAADLVIHNGGSGSVNQCLLAGVPFIGAASNLDQFSTMYFAEGAGLGKTIRADRIVASALVRLAGELLDDASFRQRAAAVQSRAQAFKPSDILMEELDKMGLGRS
jgi:UDP:flavonoid glycosyltransferase YjiC (YdhE family)